MSVLFPGAFQLVTTSLKTCKDHIALIQRLAIERWGSEITGYGKPKWQPELVNAYCAIAQAQGEEDAKPVNRRSQIMRALETGSCTADTLILLYAALGCRLEVVREERLVP